MANILAVTDGPAGGRFAILELGRRLAAAGHAVTFAGPAGARDLALHNGLGFEPLPPNRLTRFLEEDASAGMLDRLRRLPERRAEARSATGVDRYVELLESRHPDLVLLDAEMQEQIVVTVAAGTPVALLNTFASIWRQAGSPPPHTPVRPGRGWRGSRLGMGAAWTAFRLSKRLRSVRKRFRQVGCDRVSGLRALARERGLDLAREIDSSQWLIPFTWPRLPTLSLHALEFELIPDPPDGVSFVGPMVLRERGAAPLADRDRRRLDDVLARHAGNAPGRALIYAGFGSFFTARTDWLSRLLEAVARRPGWELVLSLGGRHDDAGLGDLPDGVHAFPWVPQLEALAHADAAVVHGGINTIDECVMAGVPMLVCCGEATDMAGNTARVVHHGLGLAADPTGDDADRILEDLDRLLEERTFRDRLDRMRRACARYEEERVAERVVDDLLSGSRGPRP